MELVEERPNVELRRGPDGRSIVVLSFPYDPQIVAAVRAHPAAALRLGHARVVGARRRLGRGPRRRGARSLPGADHQRPGRRLAGGHRAPLGRPRDDHAPRRPRLVGPAHARRARCPRRCCEGAVEREDGALLAPLTPRGRRGAGRSARRRAHGRRRAPLPRLARARRGSAARAPGRERDRRRDLPAPRRALGPRRRRRLRRAARRRRPRPLAAHRPVGRRGARRLPGPARRRRRRLGQGDARRAARRVRRGADRDPRLARDERRADRRDRRRASAASSRPSSGRACATRCARGAPSSPTSRAWARPSRRWRRSRPTTPSRPSSSAPPR